MTGGTVFPFKNEKSRASALLFSVFLLSLEMGKRDPADAEATLLKIELHGTDARSHIFIFR